MTPSPRPLGIDPEEVLAHDTFVRGLARQLVHDAHTADDLAQQAWVAACRQTIPALSLRGWLATVVRRLAGRRARADRREIARQGAAAKPELVPSTAEIVQREAVRAEVVRAVLELAEPYRTVVLLRWFENLPPRAVAKRLGVPVETVRTRLRRALAALRQRLDDHAGGDRVAWCALLLPFAGRPGAIAAAGALSSFTLGAFLMSIANRSVVVGVLLAGLLAGALWFGSGARIDSPPGEARTPAAPRAAGADASVPEDDDRVESAAADPFARERVDAAPATTGSLVVRVLHADQLPAVDVLIELLRSGEDDLLDRRRGRTDERGEVRFTGLAPGRVTPAAIRPDHQLDERMDIIAGQESTATIVLGLGIEARGIVVDTHGAPIAGAEVLAADWAGAEAQVMAHTTRDGTFSVRGMSTHCHVGARAAGWCASSMHTITASAGAAVDLRIVLTDPGATVTGIVLGPQNEPVDHAIVSVGSTAQNNHRLPDGTQAMAPRPALVHTDAAGRFAADNLRAGRLPVAVRAPDLAPWEGEVEVDAGGRREMTVQLQAGVSLDGVVRNAEGAPVASAEVRVGEYQLGLQLGLQRRRTGSNGEFHFAGLPVGEFKVFAEHAEFGSAEARLDGAPGERLRWEPTITTGLSVHGRVLDDEGNPVAKVILAARAEQSSGTQSWWAHATSDTEGRFTLKQCRPGVPIRIDVQRTSMVEARVRHLQPGDDEIVIRLPKAQWVRIRGTVLDPDGRPLPNVRVRTASPSGGGGDLNTVDPKTGTFDVGPYPPGELTLRLETAGYAPIRARHTLAPDEVWDLGTLEFQRGGSLVASLLAPTAEALTEARVAIYDQHGDWVANAQVAAGMARGGPYATGDYVLQIRGGQVAALRRPFSIRLDTETKLDIQLQTGVAVELAFDLPPGAADDSVPIEVLAHDGALVVRSLAWPREGKPELREVLEPGTYRVHATGPRFAGEGTIQVAAPGPVRASIALTTR